MTFGKRLRQARTEKRMTQKQLAELIGAKHNSVSDWENDKNKPDPDTIELLCGALEISPNYLLNTKSDDISVSEKEIIRKYRALDEHGKEMVDFTLLKEWERSCAESDKANKVIQLNYNALAAHAKENQSDEDVASDIDFIKSLKQKLDKELDKDKS